MYILRHIAELGSYIVFEKMNAFPATAFESSLSYILKVKFLENDVLLVVAQFEC